MAERRGRAWGWWAAAAWAASIFALSASSDVGQALGFLEGVPGIDKIAHAGSYAVLGGLLRVATGRGGAAVALAAGYGVTDEVHQAFVPGRTPDPLDWLADVAGATMGAALVASFARRRRTPTVE